MITPDTLERLRAANPAVVDEEDGRGPVAQAGLARILADDGRSGADRGFISPRPPGRRAPRGLALVLAALVVGGGAAVAATDPFGWRSNDPSTARYGVNPSLRVRTPSIQEINCRPAVGGFRCRAGARGQVYMRTDAIRAPLHNLTRARFARAISRALADQTITDAEASKFRADLAAVPGSFFTDLELWSRYGTYAGGPGRVPPPGVPMFLVCEDSGRALACQDLNGDERAPVGAGVYQALQNRNWRPGPRRQSHGGLPPGAKITRPEYRLLFDLFKTAKPIHSGSSSGYAPPVRAARSPSPRAARRRTSR